MGLYINVVFFFFFSFLFSLSLTLLFPKRSAHPSIMDQSVIHRAVDSVLQDKSYNPKRVQEQTSAVVEAVLTALQGKIKNVKLIATAVITQRSGQGLSVATSCLWDAQRDHSVSVRVD